MFYGNIQFGKVGTDEIICEVPWSPAVSLLCRARLEECGNTSFDEDSEALGRYAVFYGAEMAGHKLVSLPGVKDIRPSDVYLASVEYDFKLVNPDEDEDGEMDEADENPTGMEGASSSH